MESMIRVNLVFFFFDFSYFGPAKLTGPHQGNSHAIWFEIWARQRIKSRDFKFDSVYRI
jgi:hypothetical protein